MGEHKAFAIVTESPVEYPCEPDVVTRAIFAEASGVPVALAPTADGSVIVNVVPV